MEKFSISEKYRLEVHWNQVSYNLDEIALLKGCYLSGPVLSNILKLNEVDYMDLDFVNQYTIFIDNYYIARLSWQGVHYIKNKIFLKNVKLENKNVNVVPKLKYDDYIVIDTQNHEEELHPYFFVYTSYLLNMDGTLYDFRSMKYVY
jgi:hypothetical protein